MVAGQRTGDIQWLITMVVYGRLDYNNELYSLETEKHKGQYDGLQ